MFSVHTAPETTVREALGAHDDFTAGLLARRGIKTKEEAEAFLSPEYDKHLHDPMLFTDMPKAAERLSRAIDQGEKIAVWSDYDCDGIPGAVVLHDFLKKAGANFTNYIPHRHLEGYGMNEGGLQRLSLEGVSLVITVDVGIVDLEPVAYAKELGMDVIVTDHHVPSDALPDAYAVIDHKRADETYPFRELCGAATAWKLVCATLQHGFRGREEIQEGWEKWLLDMAGLSTIADMVPLVGENRVIAKYGLVVMRKSPRIGLQKLLRAARVNQRFITEDDVGFSIAPRINAASRMGDPMTAFRLFTTEDENEADELVKILEKANRGRRSAAGAITRQVHTRLKEREAIPSIIAMGDPDWRPGLLGLVANSVADEYQRPVFLWGREATTLIKGSVRAGRPDVHVVKLMTHAREVFVEFGGHAQAGGFSVKEDQVFFLEERLSQAHDALPKEESENNAFVADIALSPDDVSLDLLSKLSRLAPFGVGNPKPVVLLQDVDITEAIRFGKAEEHLKLRIKREFSEPLEAVAFYAKSDWEKKGRASILGNLERDTFSKGQPVRLRLLMVS